MIDQEKISKQWLQQVVSQNKQADEILVEKVIRALLLLEGLVIENIPFVFKGGTALMLHQKSTKRLSIDIDIVMESKPNDFIEKLNKIASSQGFTYIKQNERKVHSTIDKEHIKFFYKSLAQPENEDAILLDILFEKPHYKNIIQLPIVSQFVSQKDEPLPVNVPSVEDLLGDKLTAFPPNTTGIPYFKGEKKMSMEIMKQLYDIGDLINNVQDISTVKQTFIAIANIELIYRNKTDLDYLDVLNDIEDTAITIISRGQIGGGNFIELQQGIKRVSSFIFSEKFQIEKAIIAASKAAYLASLIKHNKDTIELYNTPLQMKDWVIIDPALNKLNKLKKSNPEAFYYIYKMIDLKILNSK